MKNYIKRVLSLVLAFCMMLSMTSINVYATDGIDVEEKTMEEQTVVEKNTSADSTEIADTAEPSIDASQDADASAVNDGTAVMTINDSAVDSEDELMAQNDGAVVLASASGIYSTRPADGTTSGQPFSSGTGGSTNFRIPALITLSNGNLLAACDARYSGTGDGYGLDTIVSYSTDNGSTWNYSYANYFNDSSGYNTSASAFIDPVLIQDEEGAVYLFTDLYPGGGYYIANIKSGTGFTTVDGISYLALYSSTSATSYTTPAYYVANELNSDGYYTVYDYSSKSASNYALDAEYNIYTVSGSTYTAVTGTQIDSSSTTINANVFYTGTANQSGLYVLGTEYITMRKGTVNTDGSITWGGLQLLNIKNSSEYFYGFGPGGGIVTSTGRIIVPLYTYANGADGKTSVIYSDDNGATWTRSADMNVQTSEASISEVTVGGKKYLYMFTRHGGYFVSEDNGKTWSTQKSVSGISYTTSCELSTLTYSRLIDGCPAILLSAPTSNRTTGKIFVGLVQSDGSITWKYTYGVNGSGTFQYSDLTELSDGSIGLLYENGDASITYTKLAISTIASGAVIGDPATEENPKEVEVTVVVGQTKTITDTTGSFNTYSGGPDTSIATIKLDPYATGTTVQAQLGSDANYDGEMVSLSNALFTFTGSGASYTISATVPGTTTTVYLKLPASAPQCPCNTTTGATTIGTGETTGTFTLFCNERYLYFWRNGNNYFDRNSTTASPATDFLLYRQAADGETSSTEIPGYVQVTSTDQITNGGQYLIVALYNGTYYVLYPSNSSTKYDHVAKIVTGEASSCTDITINGVAVGDTSVQVGTTKYIIHVVERGGSDTASVTVGGTATVSIPEVLGDGESIKWTVSDSIYAGVYSADGVNATITGRAEGDTVITATIYDANDEVVATYIWNTTVTSGSLPNAGSYTVTFSYDVTVYNGTVYYSVDGGPLKAAVVDTTSNDTADGEVGTTYTVQEVDQNVAYASIIWFVQPNEGYAVTTVGADENSYSQFYALDKENLTFTYGANHTGGRVDQFTTEEQEKALIAEAVSMGCDAIFWNSRGSESGPLGASTTASGTYVVHCDKLPTITKRVAYLKQGEEYVPYTEGMNAVVGNSIIFEIVVTTYDESANITYSDAYMRDIMSGITGTAKLYNNEQGNASQELTPINNYNITETINNDGTTGSAHTYYVEYVIQDADLDKQLTNDVTLTYNYQSLYSSGSYGGEANASAKITAVTFTPEDIVIDFGLPVTIDYSSDTAHGRYDLVSGTAAYGDVTVENNKVTYIPTATLKGVDTVTLTNEKGGTYNFKVYPATTVYYEEGFAAYGTGWSVDAGGNWSGTTSVNYSKTQQVHVVDSNSSTTMNNYGYDNAYKSDTTESNGSSAVGTTNKDSLKFSFTGTGVDIYATGTDTTGTVAIKIVDKNGSTKKLLSVDTKNVGAYSNTGTSYNTPIASVTGLDHGEYTVTMYVSTPRDSGIIFDGFRVDDTISQNKDTSSDDYKVQTEVYLSDKEDYPSYTEIRNVVISALLGENSKVAEKSVDYKDELGNNTTAQVYASADSGVALYVSANENDSAYDWGILSTLIDEGAKNELYLPAGVTLVLKLDSEALKNSESRTIQVGVKGINRAGSVQLGNSSNESIIVSTVNMFYPVNVENSGDFYTVTIKNTSESTAISLTKLKASDDPIAISSEAFTEDELANLLNGSVDEPEEELPVVTADATLNISVADYTGTELASTVLTANGKEGEENVFAAADIAEAAKSVLPEGYALADEAAVADQTVVYGEDGTVTILVGKVATLNITYKKLFGKSVGTAVLTKVQTSDSTRATFSASEIRAAVPEGYTAMSLIGTSVKYGSESSKTVYVY